MSPRIVLRWLLAVALTAGVNGMPSARADILTPKPKPVPKPPKPQPPLPPEPEPIPDDPAEVRTAIVAGSAALGVALLGVWVVRRSWRRILIQRPTVPTPS
jgi:hypothetical protein